MLKIIVGTVLCCLLTSFSIAVTYYVEPSLTLPFAIIGIISICFFLFVNISRSRRRGKDYNYRISVAAQDKSVKSDVGYPFCRRPLIRSVGSSILGIVIVLCLWITVGGHDLHYLYSIEYAIFGVILLSFMVFYLSEFIGYNKAKSLLGFGILLLFILTTLAWIVWNKGVIPGK